MISFISSKRRKVKYILHTKLHAAKYLIQSSSGLVTENFMQTIIAYRWIMSTK